MKKLREKLLDWIEHNTPRTDYLAHYYWGDILWSNIGYYSAIVLILFCPYYWWIGLPLATVVLPAYDKEKRDGEKNPDGTLKGNRDPKDFMFTILPGVLKVLHLLLLVYAFKN